MIKNNYSKGISSLLVGALFTALLSCQQTSEPHRILYINSYHNGYPASDEVCATIQDSVALWGDSLQVIYMDCKRNPSPEFAQQRAEEIMHSIRAYSPHGIIVSDDDAVKYIVADSLEHVDIPVVFCGVNWDCKQYNLPRHNVTGVLEVLPLRSLLQRMHTHYPEAKKIAILSENTVSEHNNSRILDPLYRSEGFEPSYFLVDEFDEWCSTFEQLNRECDIIYMPTNGAIKNWDREKAVAWVLQKTTKPTITCDDFMMPYTVFGLTKIASEQGSIAARMLHTILTTEKLPTDIAVEENVRTKAWLNDKLSTKISFDREEISNLNAVII